MRRGRFGSGSEKVLFERAIGLGILVLLLFLPMLVSHYWVSFIMTETFLVGIAAASLIFLAAYGGMISLAQVALYGIAAFAFGNMVTTGSVKGLHLGWSPWVSVVLAIAITTGIGALFGAVASRSVGIYFLMITLTYAVMANLFFGSVTRVSGFSGISGITDRTPGIVGNPNTQPNRLYYLAFVVALAVYLSMKYIIRTPFGVALQGIRDDPLRMASLGYNVPLHRTLAFTFAAFAASLAGVLYGWWNGQIDPSSINLGETINLLIIAVIGGLGRIEGAWLGAFTFIVINNYVRDVSVPVLGGSFNTVIGFIFLGIVIVSPFGLMGIWDRAMDALFRGRGRGGDSDQPPVAAQPSAAETGSA